MIDGLLASLDRIRVRAAAVAEAFDDAVALLPGEATGVDPTGAVTARLGPDGRPTALRVAPDWARRVAPEQVGSAVVRACRAAAAARSAEWAHRLELTGWRARADGRLTGPAPPRPAPSRCGPAAPPTVPPRPLEQIARDVHAALRDAGRPAPAPRAVGAAAGHLTITLTPAGVTGCVAEPRWVAGQTGAMLTNALAVALHAALTDARRTLDGAPDVDRPTARDGLFTEALAALTTSATPTTARPAAEPAP